MPVEALATLAERVAAEVDDRTALVGISAVLFMTAQLVPGLAAVAAACERHGAELLVDAYHALGTIPFGIHDLSVGGFLSLVTPRAADVRAVLSERGVLTDSRPDRLRVGPAPYLSDQQPSDGVAVIGEVASALSLG